MRRHPIAGSQFAQRRAQRRAGRRIESHRPDAAGSVHGWAFRRPLAQGAGRRAARLLRRRVPPLLSLWVNPSELLLTRSAGAATSLPPQHAALPVAALDRMMKWDFLRYLPDDIFVKVDRATMAVSLEGRMPLLDHRVVEFAWQVPEHYEGAGWPNQVAAAASSLPLRAAPAGRSAEDGLRCPDRPLAADRLREWAADLLSHEALRREGIFDAAAVQAHWRQHLSGERSWAAQLWTILMFQAWRRAFDAAPVPRRIAQQAAAAAHERASVARLQGIGSAH